MWKKHKKTLVITSLIILLPILFGLLLWNRLPETMPTHWGPNGEADGWSSRTSAVFLLPLILLGAHLFCVAMTSLDPKNSKQNAKTLILVLWICPILSLVMGGATYAAALGFTFDMNRLILPLMGVLFIVVGNYLPKCKPNYTIGIKLPWTLDSAENWTATHRFAGPLWIVGGVLFVITGFLSFINVLLPMIVLTLLLALAPAVYSYLFYRRHGESPQDTAAEETEE